MSEGSVVESDLPTFPRPRDPYPGQKIVSLPSISAELLLPYPCTLCHGFRSIHEDWIEKGSPKYGVCPECHGQDIKTLTIDAWAIWKPIDHHSPCPTVEVWTRRRYPWKSVTNVPRDMSCGIRYCPAWGSGSLAATALASAIDVIQGRPDNVRYTVLYTSIRLTGPVAWPDGWERTR